MRFPAFAVYIDTRKLATYTVLAFVIGSLLGGAMWNFGGVYIPELPPSNLLVYGSLTKFASEAELVNFLETMPSGGHWVNGLKGRGFITPFASVELLAEDTATAASGSPGNSRTH